MMMMMLMMEEMDWVYEDGQGQVIAKWLVYIETVENRR